MEENFLLLFRFDNPLDSSVEFMKVRPREEGSEGEDVGQGGMDRRKRKREGRIEKRM